MKVSRSADWGTGRARATLPTWPSALVVIAHPDDESFGLGAVIGQFTAAGADVHILSTRMTRVLSRTRWMRHQPAAR